MKFLTPKEYSRCIGQVIKSERMRHINKSLQTQAELAEVVGINRSYLAGVENGSRMPGLETLVSITQALGISMSELFVKAEKLNVRDNNS